MSYTTDRMGWRPDLPDYRDEPYRFENALRSEILSDDEIPVETHPQAREVAKVPVVDQGRTGSCVGEGTAFTAAVERNVGQRSGAFIYAEARKMIGELHLDNGAYGRHGCAVACTAGVPHFKKWPTVLGPDGHQLRVHEDPNEKADADALKRKLFAYHGFGYDRGREFRSCLASKRGVSIGHLFMIGFSVYSNIADSRVSRFGIVQMPSGSFWGGHWVSLHGHHDNFRESEWAQWARNGGYPESMIPERVYYGRNSWGDWGRGGDFVIDARYLESHDLARDARTLRGFEDERR